MIIQRRRLCIGALSLVPCLAPAPSGIPTASASAPPVVALSVSYSHVGPLQLRATLNCRTGMQRATGFLARHSAALLCRRARLLRSFLASIPDPRRLCSQIYGGPDRALIAGTIGGIRIGRHFARTDGCKTSDWNRARLLLPPVP
ncbi:MAG: hypothetical protein ACJ76S_07425 [Solirubrobacteraceae bacterium]